MPLLHPAGQAYAAGAITDMQLGDSGDPMTAYIAVTRVKDRHGLRIYTDPSMLRPIRRDAAWEALLLEAWWGESVDWATLRARYREEEACSERHESY